MYNTPDSFLEHRLRQSLKRSNSNKSEHSNKNSLTKTLPMQPNLDEMK